MPDPCFTVRGGAAPGVRYRSAPFVLDEERRAGRLRARYWSPCGQVWPEMHLERVMASARRRVAPWRPRRYTLSMQIHRLSAKAIIVRDGLLLTIRCRDSLGDWYLLPGGGQEHGETLHEALQRECLEEIGTRVVIGDARYVHEYIGKNHEFAAEDGHIHQVSIAFVCSLPEGAEPAVGSVPDAMQTAIEWLPIQRIAEYRLYPQGLRAMLAHPEGPAPVYLGDVN